MRAYKTLPVAHLNKLLRYDPDTGKLFWRVRVCLGHFDTAALANEAVLRYKTGI